MERLKKVVAIILLVSAMSTTAIGFLPSKAYAATGVCDAAGCDAGEKLCAEITTSILWGLIAITTKCYDNPKQVKQE